MAGFISETIATRQPLVNNNFTHAACIGQTGCGKTSSFILPNVRKRLQEGYGIFVVDFKGSLSQQIKSLALKENRIEDVVEIGMAWGENINFLANVSKELFLESIEKLDGDGKNDKFWTTSALSLLGIVYDIIKYLEYIKSLKVNKYYHESLFSKYKLNIKTFVDILQDKSSIRLFLKDIGVQSASLQDCIKSKRSTRNIKLTLEFLEKIKHLGKKLHTFSKDIDENSPASGASGVLFVTKSYLNSYDIEGLNGDLDVLDMLEDKKIVIIKADSFSKYAMEGFMHILYAKLVKKEGNTPISLIIDEFQRTVTKNSVPFVDVFREKKVELLAAFQNLSQLRIKLGEEKTEEFMLNIVSRFDYAQKDEFDLKTFEYITNGKKYIARPIFLTKEELRHAQYIWQIKTKKAIKRKGKWIYHRSYDAQKCTILNIDTEIKKEYYILNKEKNTKKYSIKM